MLARTRFESLLVNAGINITSPRVVKIIDHIELRHPEDMKNALNTRNVMTVYSRAARMVTTATKLKANESDANLIVNDIVWDAFSTRSYFQYVLLRRKLHVFKYPQDPGVSSLGLQSIRRDVDVSRIICNSFGEHAHRGFVLYSPFILVRSDGSQMEGNISFYYPMTLAKLSTPLPLADVIFWGRQIFSAIKKLHSIKYSINDLKPNNLYLDNDGNCYIADYGGVTQFGEPLSEYSPEFLPQELYQSEKEVLVTDRNDKYCLISTMLCLLKRMPPVVTIGNLVANVTLLRSAEFTDLVNEIIN
jgi:hypothetical protein